MIDTKDLLQCMETCPLVVFDLETNGLETGTAILEIGALCVPPGCLEDARAWTSFESLIRFNGIPNPMAFAVNKIPLSELKQRGRRLEHVLAEFVEFCKDAILVGHNIIDFDLRILDYHLKKHDHEMMHSAVIDTKRLSKQTHPYLVSHSLENLVRHFGISSHPTHRAKADVLATFELFKYLIQANNVRV